MPHHCPINGDRRGLWRSRRRFGQRPMIARRKILTTACICLALATVGARAADPSAKAFVESIYAAYKGKDSKGISLETDAAVRRYFDPKLAPSSSKTARTRRARSASLAPIPSSMRRIGRSTPSTSPSVPSRPTRPCSKARCGSGPGSSPRYSRRHRPAKSCCCAISRRQTCRWRAPRKTCQRSAGRPACLWSCPPIPSTWTRRSPIPR